MNRIEKRNSRKFFVKRKEESLKWVFFLSGICGFFSLVRQIDSLVQDYRLLFFVMAAVSVILFILEFLVKTHWPVYISMTGVMLGLAFMGIRYKIVAMFLIALFQFSFWMLHTIKNTSGNLSVKKMERCSVIGITLFFLIAAALVHWNLEWFYQAVYQAEGMVVKKIKRAAGTTDHFSDGVVNRGNIYPNGMEQMEISVSKEPSEAVYLKEFSGGAYADGKWERADEADVFKQMNENTLHWRQWNSWVSGMYESMYFVMNKNMKNHTEFEEREMLLRYEDASENEKYIPYFSVRGRGSKEDGQRNNEGAQENHTGTEESGNVIEYRREYYEQKEIQIDWAQVEDRMELAGEWYHMIQTAYAKEAKAFYTEVLKDEIPRLVSLCEAHPLEDVTQITSFIYSYLRENASYTQTPGMLPLHTDAVEYFLFDKNEGYCQHFASAAVLMYRLYGIPARYATGYRIAPSDFEYQEDGFWHAVVTDHSAHAWPEIFVEDYGWIPVEVTPAAEPEAEISGIIGGWQDFASHPPEAETTTEDSSNNQAGSGKKKEPQPEEKLQPEKDRQNGQGIYISKENIEISVLCAGAVVIVGAAGIILWQSRFKRKWMRKGGCRRIYQQMLRRIHAGGYLREYDGSEKEFPVKLTETFSGISYEEAAKLVDYVSEEAFGRGNVLNSDHISFIEEMYEYICNISMY